MENQVRFYGRGTEFFGIWIVNLLLSIVTLGIYSAWAKVRTKKYFYGNTELAGDSFDYHAQPLQILKGRIVAMICVGVWAVAGQFFPAVATILLIASMLLMPWLIRNNTRFDARMCSYRNVRFDFVGSLKGAYGVFLGWPALSFMVIALGMFFSFSIATISLLGSVVLGFLTFALGFVIYAWLAALSASYFINGYRYGDREFSGNVDFKVYIKTYLLGGLLGAGLGLVMVVAVSLLGGVSLLAELNSPDPLASQDPSLGMVVAVIACYAASILVMLAVTGFVQARLRNYLFGQIKADGEPQYRLGSRMTTWGLVGLIITNFLLLMVTLGIARPWVMVRSTRYVADTTYVTGDLQQLKAEGADMGNTSAVADEVANAFDMNMGIG